jgi:hypothetical protein
MEIRIAFGKAHASRWATPSRRASSRGRGERSMAVSASIKPSPTSRRSESFIVTMPSALPVWMTE